MFTHCKSINSFVFTLNLFSALRLVPRLSRTLILNQRCNQDFWKRKGWPKKTMIVVASAVWRVYHVYVFWTNNFVQKGISLLGTPSKAHSEPSFASHPLSSCIRMLWRYLHLVTIWIAPANLDTATPGSAECLQIKQSENKNSLEAANNLYFASFIFLLSIEIFVEKNRKLVLSWLDLQIIVKLERVRTEQKQVAQ